MVQYLSQLTLPISKNRSKPPYHQHVRDGYKFSKMFGLTGIYTAAIGTNNYGGDPMYFLTFGLMCLNSN
jgi:hypothetical protein